MWFKRGRDADNPQNATQTMPDSRGTAHLSKGAAAEIAAQHFLEKQGLRTIARNYRSKSGEIDLVMEDRQTLVFVEVRLRSNRQFSSAAESVNFSKQQKIIRTAHGFLQQYQLTDQRACRFDVIALSPTSDQTIEWIRDAFCL